MAECRARSARRAEPAGRGQPGDRQAARGRPAHPAEEDGARQHGAVARPGWRAEPPAAHTEGPASLSGKAAGGGAGEGEATAVTVPGRPGKPAWARPRAKASRAKEGRSCIFLGLKNGGKRILFSNLASGGAAVAPPPPPGPPLPRSAPGRARGGLCAPQGPEPPSQGGSPRGPAGRGGARSPAGPRGGPGGAARRQAGRPGPPPGRASREAANMAPSVTQPPRPPSPPATRTSAPLREEDRAGERLKVCFPTRRPPRGRGGPRAPKS